MTPASFPMRPDGAEPPEGGLPPGGRMRDALPPGTLVGGGYRIERTLGQGGFGIVYLAADLALQRPVAIKEFLPVHLACRLEGLQISLREPQHRDAFGRGLQSFLREARLLAQFDHPSLVRVYRFWEENQTAYMAMPYYEGPTLAAVRQGMLRPPDEPWLRDQLLLPLLGALQTLHEGHCLHRDVAPGNILLLPDGRPILLDFGSARRVVGDMTQPLTAIVNPAYAAIEQYAESPNLPQGPWTDLYGLACVAYFALSGRAPAPATVRAVNETSLMPMAEVGQAVAQSFPGLHYSPSFLAAIDRALSLRPADRPQTVAELREALASPHVQPDVAIEEPRRAGPPPVEEIRIPEVTEPEPEAEPPVAAASDDAAAERQATEAPEDDEQAAIRATIQTALGEIANWPSVSPRAVPTRGQPARVEPVFGAPEGASGPARRASPGKAHLTVVSDAEAARRQELGAARAEAEPDNAARSADDASRAMPPTPDTGEPVLRAIPEAPSAPAETPPVRPPVASAAPAAPVEPIPPQRPPLGADTRPAPALTNGENTRVHDEPLPESTPFVPPPELRPPRDIASPEPFLPPRPATEREFGAISAGEPTLDPHPPAFSTDDLQPPVDEATTTAASKADALAEVVPIESAPSHAERWSGERAAPPGRDRGQGWRAAAAVVAAALLGGGLWYAQDLGGAAWRWMGWGSDDTQTAAMRAPTTAGHPAAVAAARGGQIGPAGSGTATQDQTGAAVPTPARQTGQPATVALATPGVAPLQPSELPSSRGSSANTTSTSGTTAGPGGAAGTAPSAAVAAPPTTTPTPPSAVEERSPAALPPDDTSPDEPIPATNAAAAGNNKTATAPPSIADVSKADSTPTAARPNAKSSAESPPARIATAPAKATPHRSPPPPQVVAQAKPSFPPTARAACGTRRNFALYYCMKAQCRLERYARTGECVRLREDDEVE